MQCVLIENFVHQMLSITETPTANKVRGKYNRFHGHQQQDETKLSDPLCSAQDVHKMW
jgi:hypothetical protein